MKKIQKFVLIAFSSLISLCLLFVGISALSNLGLPQQSARVEMLSEVEKIHLAETLYLRQEVGDKVWPGWGQADIPAIAYNESYAFLLGYPDPPDGWVKIPRGFQRGGPWEIVPDDTFYDQLYYREPLPDPDISPENFTVMVGEHWVSSIQTYEAVRFGLIRMIRQDLPPFAKPIFPYSLFIDQLLDSSDKYITLSLHESFHAYQGMLASGKLADSENTNREYDDQYPWDDAALQADWQTELDLLADALQSTDQNQTVELARRFIEARAARRDSSELTPELITYEQQREWLEGLARYAELESWRLAYEGNYTPLPETALLTDFYSYDRFETRWTQEINQMRRMAVDEGDGRFYYSGMGQAILLDRLMPNWKLNAFEEDYWLDDLLDQVIVESFSHSNN